MKNKVSFGLSMHARVGESFLLLMEFLNDKFAEEPDTIISEEKINLDTKFGFTKYCLYFTFFAYKKEFFEWLKLKRESEDIIEEDDTEYDETESN